MTEKIDDTSPAECEQQNLKWFKVWFDDAKDPPKQIWKEVLHKLNDYVVKFGYIKNSPEYCYVILQNRKTEQIFKFSK